MEKIIAVLIHQRIEPFEELTGALKDLSVESYSAMGDLDAAKLIAQHHPHLLFVDHPVWSKSRARIVNLASDATQPLNIVVVGHLPDIELYVSTIEEGAFNFVVPPFSHDKMTMLVHTAAKEARNRRELLARASVPPETPAVDAGLMTSRHDHKPRHRGI